jgi:hypothetical protein
VTVPAARSTPGFDPTPPEAPPALAGRVEAALQAWAGERGEPTAERTTEAYLGAAERLLRRLLREEGNSRLTAVDLLAADALVTLAFELAGDEPDRVDERAHRAMAQLAALATPPSASER